MEMARQADLPASERVPYTPIVASARAHQVLGTDVYEFYRCQWCNRIVTQPEMIARMEATQQRKRDCALCPCGGFKVSPIGPNVGMRWWDWLRPNVLRFAFNRWRGVA